MKTMAYGNKREICDHVGGTKIRVDRVRPSAGEVRRAADRHGPLPLGRPDQDLASMPLYQGRNLPGAEPDQRAS